MKQAMLAVALCIALPACNKPQAEGDQAPAPVVAPTAETSPAETAPVDEAVAVPAPFSKTLELQGITFKVDESAGKLTVTPSGLETVNDPVSQDIAGHVTSAEVADLDADGSPEVYVFLRAGDDAHGGVVGYAANKRKSLSEIYLPPLAEDAKNSKGYGGGDEFAVLENRIGQRFPIVGEDGKPTGKTRQLQYRLEPGEAGWRLVLDRTTEY